MGAGYPRGEILSRPRFGVARQTTFIAISTALSAVLMYLEMPLPLLPPYLKYDLGDLPALLIALSAGAAPALAVEVGKEMLFLLVRGGSLIGVGANLLAGTVWVAMAAGVYALWPTGRGRVAALACAGLATTAVMCVANAWLFLPVWGIPREAVATTVWTAILPFNLVKVTLTGFVAVVVYPYVASAMGEGPPSS